MGLKWPLSFFSKLSQYPPVLTDGALEILEKFVVLLYE